MDKMMHKRIASIIICIAMLVPFTVGAAAAEPFDDSRYFNYGDYSLHYRIVSHSGEFKGRIAMLHGFVCSTYSWRNMASGLAKEGYDCVMIDLPNFGYSTRESNDIEAVDRELLVEELLKTIAPMDEWILAGHSMGGGVCINIANDCSVKALILYCPAPQGAIPKAVKPIMTSCLVRGAMNAFFDIGLKVKPLVRLVIYAATFDWQFAKNYDLRGVIAPLQYRGSGAGMCYMLCNVRTTALGSADKITAPVLIVQAEKDIVLSAAMKKNVDSAFPTAQKYVVIGGGHQCIENRADELVPLTAGFLAQAAA